jgi:hypothetical protein
MSSRTVLDDRMTFYIFYRVIRAGLVAGNERSLDWCLVDLGILVFRSV